MANKIIFYERASKHLSFAHTMATRKDSILAHLSDAYEALLEVQEDILAKDVNELWQKIYRKPRHDYSAEFNTLESSISNKRQGLKSSARFLNKIAAQSGIFLTYKA